MKPYFESKYSKLYNGDCIDVMQKMIDQGIKIDKIITSPPYNIIKPNRDDRGYDLYNDGMTNEEYIDWTINVFNLSNKLMNKNGCILYNMSYGSENTECMPLTVASIINNTNFTIADILVWKKRGAIPNCMSSNKMTRITELVYVFCRKDEFKTFTCNKKISTVRDNGIINYENVFNFFEADNNDETQDLNKATFSTQFVQNLIDRYVLKEDIVLDMFNGTGTTIYCCEQNEIKSYGIELSEKQCEHTKKRFLKGVQTMLL